MMLIGDVIECADKDDAVDTMTELAAAGIQTEFVYNMDGKRGIWLIVTEIEE